MPTLQFRTRKYTLCLQGRPRPVIASVSSLAHISLVGISHLVYRMVAVTLFFHKMRPL
jgi:hypothetical protein